MWVSGHTFGLATSLVIFLKYGMLLGVVITLLGLLTTVGIWFATLYLERLAGFHTFWVMENMKISFFLFILREGIFFFAIFWAFFDSALSPRVELGMEWTPLGVRPIRPYGIPLLNTMLLLASRWTLTWAHNSLLGNGESLEGSLWTLALGLIFLYAQYVEYRTATFSIRDGIYGRVFFFGTGFHGLHVIFGLVFISVTSIIGYYLNAISSVQCLRFEFAVIYWHFVDVVWLFLYTFIYWWSY